jgi:hypothetical protein
MLSSVLLVSIGPDALDPTGLWLCAGPFPSGDLLLLRDPLLSPAPVLFIAPLEYTGPDASDPTGRSFAGDINPAFGVEQHVETLVERFAADAKGGVT